MQLNLSVDGGWDIRPYRAPDAAAIAQLFYDSVRVLGPRRYTVEQTVAWAPAVGEPARWHSQCRDGRTMLVAVERSGRLLAFSDLEASGHVDRLFAHPDAAGTGVAGALLDRIIALAEQQGLARLHTEASELARGLFQRKGFHVLERRDFELRGVMIHNYAMERISPPA